MTEEQYLVAMKFLEKANPETAEQQALCAYCILLVEAYNDKHFGLPIREYTETRIPTED